MISHQPQHYCWVKLPFLVTEIVWDAAADTWGAYETQVHWRYQAPRYPWIHSVHVSLPVHLGNKIIHLLNIL